MVGNGSIHQLFIPSRTELLHIQSMAYSYSFRHHILTVTNTIFIFSVSLIILVLRLICAFIFTQTLHLSGKNHTKRHGRSFSISCRWLKIFRLFQLSQSHRSSAQTDEENQFSPSAPNEAAIKPVMPPSPAISFHDRIRAVQSGNLLKNKQFHENENTNLINKYLLIYCVLNACISFIDCLYPLLTCRQLLRCHFDKTYASKFIRKYLIGYAHNSLYMICIILNILIALNRYFTIFYKHKHLRSSLKSATLRLIKFKNCFLVLAVACLVLHAPYLFNATIEKNGESYRLVVNYRQLKYLVVALFSVRYLVCNGIFLVVNLSLALNAYKYVKNRRSFLNKFPNRTPETAMKTINKYNQKMEICENSVVEESSRDSSLDIEPIKPAAMRQNGADSPVSFLRDPIGKSDWNLLKMSLFISLIYFVQLFVVVTNFGIINAFSFSRRSSKDWYFTLLSSLFSIESENKFTAQILILVSDLITQSVFYLCNILEMVTYFKYNRRFSELFRYYFLKK